MLLKRSYNFSQQRPDEAPRLASFRTRFYREPGSREMEILEQAKQDWEALGPWRERRRLNRDLLRGRQWNRLMDDPDNPGKKITEKAYIERSGRVPHKMNHVSPALRNLVGRLLQNKSERAAYAVDRDDSEAAEQMTVAMRATRRFNRTRMLEPDQFMEHLTSGLNAWKITADYVPHLNRDEVMIDRVHPTRLFWNQDVDDRRLKGLRRIGEIHDVTLQELISKFAETPEQEEAIKEIYSDQEYPFSAHGPVGFEETDAVDFTNPTDPSKCRLYEIWRLEYEWVVDAIDPETGWSGRTEWSVQEIESENSYRRKNGFKEIEYEQRKEPTWTYLFMTPTGHVLEEGVTPYVHELPPYVLGFAAWFDGEFWGLVEDIEDPQRLVNRLTVAIDYMLAASAKGVLLVDEDVVAASKMNLDDIATEWTKFNGVVALKLRPGMPINQQIQQITANAIPAGIFQWLAQQKEWIDELSGVLGAVKGEAPTAGTPSSLYMQQTNQANLTTLLYFETFFETLYEVDRRVLQLILQFVDEPRQIATGDRAPVITFDPNRVRGIDWDVVVGDASDTATYRQMFEQSMEQFLAAGHLTFRQFLEVSSHPRAHLLLKLIERTNPLIAAPSALDQAGAGNPELTAALMQAAKAGDVEARTLLMQAEQWPASNTQTAMPG